MSKWTRTVKSLDSIFMFSALLCSSLFFILIYGLFLDVAQEASESSATSFSIAGFIMVITYFYWMCRAMWYMFKTYRRKVNE